MKIKRTDTCKHGALLVETCDDCGIVPRPVSPVGVSATTIDCEYRVIWQREGRVQQVRRYAKEKGARMRYELLTGAEPWKLLGYKASDYVCCAGTECGCGGETFKQKTERINAETPLKIARLEVRTVGDWQEATPMF